MQTFFTPAQLKNPNLAEADAILRKCVHCGFCTATCPTYVELGDELDSPRGRIYLIKEMLESGKKADERTVTHIDRCLTCLSCMTTCPSGVDYMHLVDQARIRIEETYSRPFGDRWMRKILALTIPRPFLFRWSLRLARFARPFARFLPGRLSGLVTMAPDQLPRPSKVDLPSIHPAEGKKHLRVALLNGCAQTVLDTEINEATIRLLTRLGVEVVVADGAGCCGALTQHMGKIEEAKCSARANLNAWHREIEREGLDHIVINASGCGTTVKDYGHMFRDEQLWARRAAHISSITLDITELLTRLDITHQTDLPNLKVAYHSACSLQHGQKVTSPPVQLLNAAGFNVVLPAESHLCCGSAGTYNLLQPEIAGKLQARKARNISATGADLVAAGNIGCMIQIGHGTSLPIVHTVQLLDWATGGPKPSNLKDL